MPSSWLATSCESPTEECVFKCQVCGYTTRNRCDVQRHQIVHTGVHLYQCEYCGKTFNKKCNLGTHIRIHTGERPYQCHLCPWSFSWKTVLRRHLESHKRSPHLPQGAREVNHELKGLCKPPISTRFAIFQCADLAAVCHRPDWPPHLGPPTKKQVLKCQVCGHTSRKKCDMHRHQMIHTGELPYKCNYCSRAFYHNSHLTPHIRIHTGQRPYQCHLCPWNSARKQELTRHLKFHKHK
ncbi:uncharacterized protein LOC142772295 [Rhipicephalus microplus]|uniref:uncharacterized protein LOC142772295 n=1 Tax=Rhipicephalus microplus TaxID=6941 RepID=UPI003F6BAE03